MTGQEYWRKRFEALHEALLKDGESSYADAEKIFAEARRSIEADLARWYVRLAKNNQVSLTEARKLLSKDELKEFHWTVEEYMRRGRENAATQQWMKELENASAKFHISRLEAIRIQMQQHLEELYGNYNDALDDTMRRLYSDGYYKTAYTLEQGFHTGFDVSRLNDKDIDTILTRPWAADGKNFSTRIWGDKDKLMNTLQTELVQGLIRGDPLQKITKRFADKMGASQSNAKRLIYTESAYFASAGEYQGMKELGVKKYEYLATLDSRTSEICQGMDGKIFKLSEYMPGTTAPPLHVHCRSTTVPYYGKGGTLRAARDEKNKTVYVPDMPYKDWKAIFVDKTQTLEKWQEKERQRYGRNKNTVINHAYIESGEYRRKFDQITDNPDVNRVLYQKAKEMLYHRSGTEIEDMYWIDGDTGDVVAKQLNETSIKSIHYSAGILNRIKGKRNLITLHTHPGSMPPSSADINSSYYHKYFIGLVVCHNGRIFKYKGLQSLSTMLFDMLVAKKKAEGYNEEKAQIEVLTNLKENGILELEEVK